MSAEIQWSAGEGVMPTWMAPKLPPPANTKAVFFGPAWSDTDKAPVAPLGRRVGERATRCSAGLIAAGQRDAPSTLFVRARSQRRPGERRDPYAVSYRLKDGCRNQ